MWVFGGGLGGFGGLGWNLCFLGGEFGGRWERVGVTGAGQKFNQMVAGMFETEVEIGALASWSNQNPGGWRQTWRTVLGCGSVDFARRVWPVTRAERVD